MYQVAIYGPQAMNEKKDLQLQCVVVYTFGNATGSESFGWQRDGLSIQAGIYPFTYYFPLCDF